MLVVYGHTAGARGTSKIDISLDGGQSITSANTAVTTAATVDIAGTGLRLNIAVGNMVVGTTYYATCAQFVEQKTGFVFAQATATKCPAYRRRPLDGQPSLQFDGADDFMTCATAGVVASMTGNNTPWSLIASVQSQSITASAACFFSAGKASGVAFADIFSAATTGNWQTLKKGDAGGALGTGSGVPIVINTNYTIEWYQTGTTQTLVANGTTLLNASSQNTGAATFDTLCIGAAYVNGVASSFWSGYVTEFALYSGALQSTLAPVVSYFNARYATLALTAIAEANFNDAAGFVLSPVIPKPLPPNDYINHRWGRLKYTGSGPMVVTAIATVDSPAPVEPFDQVTILSDGVVANTLDYSGEAYGVRRTRTYTPADNNTHTVEVEEYASVVGVSGNYSLIAPTAPTNRVIIVGDSRVMPYLPSVPSLGWAQQVRHGIGASYQTTIYGISGRKAFDEIGDAAKRTAFTAKVVAAANGTSKNIVVFCLDINDWSVAGVTAATYGTWVAAMLTSLNAAGITGLKVLLVGMITSSNEGVVNAQGDTMDSYRATHVTNQAANPSFVSYTNLKTTCTVPGDFIGDQLHLNDTGDGKVAPVMTSAIQAL